MSTGFSLKIAKKTKKGSKVGKKGAGSKKQSVFGDAKSTTRTKISLTHVEKYEEEKPKELIIKPAALKSSLWAVPTGSKDEQIQYGLTHGEGNPHQEQAEDFVVSKPLQSSDLRWLEELPEITNEEEYEEVPVEEFGEALLRGMGWDGTREDTDRKDHKSTKLPHQEGRPLYSGIGAKGSGSGKPLNRISESSFMPLVKVNRETGERADTAKTQR